MNVSWGYIGDMMNVFIYPSGSAKNLMRGLHEKKNHEALS